jgi:hypothetical protein
MNQFMKKLLAPALLLVVGMMFTTVAVAQKTDRKPQTIDSKASTTKSDKIDKLKKPGNSKSGGPKESKSRGDVYGPDYSDIVVDNYTEWYIDIYVDGEYRGTLAPWDRKVTWAIPGNTELYAKAEFDDGSYLYWGPSTTRTGYEYTWNLKP